MLQQVMTNPGEIIFREVPVPEIKDNQVLVKIMNIGICGSDIHVYHGKHPFTKYPVTQGHEVSGEVVKTGDAVTTNGTKYYMSGTRKAICKGNTLTMYASFNTSKNGILNSQNKKAYIKYGKHTFKLTSKTKYYFSGGEAPNDYCSKSAFMSTMRSMNGLGLRIKVTNGKVVEMSFNS